MALILLALSAVPLGAKGLAWHSGTAFFIVPGDQVAKAEF